MSRRNNLLSIGDLSKLTGAGIKSLRYYERINVLKPAYVSPESGYRYYTLDQMHLVDMIMFCIELDIPLAEMKKFVEPDGTMDFRSFFGKGRDIAEKKLKALKKGLNLISHIERQMDLAEQHTIGQMYSRNIPEKTFYVKPCGKSLKDIDLMEIVNSFKDIPFSEDDYSEIEEYGFYCEHSPEGAIYYCFAEVPKDLSIKSTKIIPGGVYHCMQVEDSKIEQAAEVFNGQIGGSFLAIEIEILTGRSNVNKPIRELRVMDASL